MKIKVSLDGTDARAFISEVIAKAYINWIMELCEGPIHVGLDVEQFNDGCWYVCLKMNDEVVAWVA